MAVDVKQLIQELVVPELREMKAEVKTLQTEIKRLDEKIEGQVEKLNDKIDAQTGKLSDKVDAQGTKIDEKIDSIRHEMRSEFRRLDEKIDLTLEFRERLVKLEAKLSAYESRN